jgi:hypothetical protein
LFGLILISYFNISAISLLSENSSIANRLSILNSVILFQYITFHLIFNPKRTTEPDLVFQHGFPTHPHHRWWNRRPRSSQRPSQIQDPLHHLRARSSPISRSQGYRLRRAGGGADVSTFRNRICLRKRVLRLALGRRD